MASLISRSLTCWSPTLTSVELPIPKPILPDPKLEMSPSAKPARAPIGRMVMMAMPSFVLVRRRKKESISTLHLGGVAVALGATLAGIKAGPLGPCDAGGSNGVEEGRRRAVPAGDPDRAGGAFGSGLFDRWPGCPWRRKRRVHRLHFGANAGRC